jgi:hypothetical protein
MPRHNKKGRSTSERFVRLPHYMLRSGAWRRLTPAARCVWIEMALLYDGANNGRLAASTRGIGERLNVTHTTVRRALVELVTFGFIEIVKRSSFSQKRQASEYRMTHLRCDVTGKLAANEFMRLGRGPLQEHSIGTFEENPGGHRNVSALS